jgi:hypothetical protein
METLKRAQRFMRPTGIRKLERVREYRSNRTHQDRPKVRRGAEEKERGDQAEQTISANSDDVLKECSVEPHRRSNLGIYRTRLDRIIDVRNRVQEEMTTEAQDKGGHGMRRHEARESRTNDSVGGQYHMRTLLDEAPFVPQKVTVLFSFPRPFSRKLVTITVPLLQNVAYVAARFAAITLK